MSGEAPAWVGPLVAVGVAFLGAGGIGFVLAKGWVERRINAATAKATEANADVAMANAMKTTGETWDATVKDLRAEIARLRLERFEDAEHYAKRLASLEASIKALRETATAAALDHEVERAAWVKREHELLQQLADLRAEVESLREHAQRMTERLAARDQALDLERAIREGKAEADVAAEATDA